MEDIRKDNSICVLVTEANERVATGHLLEISELSALLKAEGIDTLSLVNSNAPEELKKRIHGVVYEYDSNVIDGIERICNVITSSRSRIVVTDIREVSNEWIRAVKNATGVFLICIDEFGNRYLDADVIINPMIDPIYWDYKGTDAIVYFGNKYLILSDKIEKYNKKEKIINDIISNVCVSMGGVDYYGTTNKIIEWLYGYNMAWNWNIVIGAGFRQVEKLHNLIEGKENIHVFQNIDYIYDLFYEADLAFCAGGNTLHELASIGTPTITIPTMPHEFQNGKKYEESGFGECLSCSCELTREEILECVKTISEKEKRKNYSMAGKMLSDGLGGKRTLSVIKQYLI